VPSLVASGLSQLEESGLIRTGAPRGRAVARIEIILSPAARAKGRGRRALESRLA
jgi:hypothetical protein